MVEVSAVHAPLLASEALDEAKGVDLEPVLKLSTFMVDSQVPDPPGS